MKVLLTTAADFRVYAGGGMGLESDKIACQSEKHRTYMLGDQSQARFGC